MTKIIINEELKNLLPPLSDEEYAGLEASILQYGCLTPIVTWNNMIVDGHYRYEICSKYGIPFSVEKITFENLADAKLWIWEHQKHRRNLTAYQRAELALQFKEIIAAKAKARQGARNDLQRNLVSPKPIETRKTLGEIAGMSHSTLHKVEYISSFADEETKARLRRGDRGTSINREYNRLQAANASVPTVTAFDETSAPKIVLEENGMLHVRNDVTPEELACFIVENFPADFVRELIRNLLKVYEQRNGTEATQQFLLKISAEFID